MLSPIACIPIKNKEFQSNGNKLSKFKYNIKINKKRINKSIDIRTPHSHLSFPTVFLVVPKGPFLLSLASALALLFSLFFSSLYFLMAVGHLPFSHSPCSSVQSQWVGRNLGNLNSCCRSALHCCPTYSTF